jgi:hypothetical protein
VTGNQQYDTDGIAFQQMYNAFDVSCAPDCHPETSFMNYLEIRNNKIDGEYSWGQQCSSSGIFGSQAVSPAPSKPPITVGFSIVVAGNSVRHADANIGGAIVFAPTWYTGPAPHRWDISKGVLVFRNEIRDIPTNVATACDSFPSARRVAINLSRSELSGEVVLYDNHCDVPSLLGNSDRVVKVSCGVGSPSSCECQ